MATNKADTAVGNDNDDALLALVHALRKSIIETLVRHRDNVSVPQVITTLGIEYARCAWLASDVKNNSDADIIASHACIFITGFCEIVPGMRGSGETTELRDAVIAALPAKLEELKNA